MKFHTFYLESQGHLNQTNSGFSGLTSSIIGSIRNLGEKTGIQDKESVYNHNGNIYWWDNFRNIVGEFTKKGVSIISENGMRSEFIGKSGIAKMAFDPFYDILFINVGGTTCYGFDKSRNEWVSEYDINFDQALHYGERCIFFKNGLLYCKIKKIENVWCESWCESWYESSENFQNY